MNTNILAIAVALPDRELLARLPVLAGDERTATAELVAHLAALRLRPSLYAAEGYGSLFAYCREALRLSDDVASNRIHAARACLKFPLILDLLASGDLSLSAVRMLRPHLTMENHERVLSRARNARRVDIERLVAELAPRPDVPSSVRRLAAVTASGPPSLEGGRPSPPLIGTQPSQADLAALVTGASEDRITPVAVAGIDPAGRCPVAAIPTGSSPAEIEARRQGTPPGPRPVVQPLSPGRYRVQFTIGQDAHDILRRLQTLLRREIPDGDAGAIFERALRVLHQDVEAAKFGKTPKGKAPSGRQRVPVGRDNVPSAGQRERIIRPGADPSGTSSATGSTTRATDPAPAKSMASARSRYISKGVRRAVWYRDRGQCAFVSESGQRCVEQEYLELHHIQPYALKGPATAANIALRCRLHNAYEAEAIFGARATRHGRSGRLEPHG